VTYLHQSVKIQELAIKSVNLLWNWFVVVLGGVHAFATRRTANRNFHSGYSNGPQRRVAAETLRSKVEKPAPSKKGLISQKLTMPTVGTFPAWRSN
jgi:hypothetical protein